MSDLPRCFELLGAIREMLTEAQRLAPNDQELKATLTIAQDMNLDAGLRATQLLARDREAAV